MVEDLCETQVQNLKNLNLQEMIEKVKRYGGKNNCFLELERFNNMSEALNCLTAERIAECLFDYSYYILNDRFPAAEPLIARKPEVAYLYAKKIIGDRFPEAEPIIAEDFFFSYFYAVDVIKGRFYEGEFSIKNSKSDAKYVYVKKFDCPEILED